MSSTPPNGGSLYRRIPTEFSSASSCPAEISFGPAPPSLSCSADSLRREVRGFAGLVCVPVEERVHPLWLRAGTGDAEASIRALDPARRGLKLAHEPRRILEIGAGAGFRSVALAVEYPGAEILATESDPECQRTALLNTLPYAGITYLTAAVSDGEARYAFFGRKGGQGRPALLAHEAGNIKAQPLRLLLHYRQFHEVDTLVITPDAASDHILRAPLPNSLRLIAVETGGAALQEATAQCFPPAQFLTVVSGDYVLLYRRGPARLRQDPRPVNVFTPDGPLQGLRLENVMPGGFFPLAGGGFRLHPNDANGPQARVTFSAENRDHSELQVSMRLVLDIACPVRFIVKVLTESGTVLASRVETVRAGRPQGMVIHLPEYDGPCEIVFATEMAEPGASNAGAWAEIISATLI